jgi:hypothetical protein
MVIVKATKDSEKGVMPTAELLAAMGKYNEELIKAGIMQGGGGLKPTSLGKRVRFSGAQRTVVNGPLLRRRSKSPVIGFGRSSRWTKQSNDSSGARIPC